MIAISYHEFRAGAIIGIFQVILIGVGTLPFTSDPLLSLDQSYQFSGIQCGVLPFENCQTYNFLMVSCILL